MYLFIINDVKKDVILCISVEEIVSHFFHRANFLFRNKKMINVIVEMFMYDKIITPNVKDINMVIL